MENKPFNILAVNPGSRYCGIAVFDGADLRDWRMRVFEGDAAERADAMKQAITRFVDTYRVSVMAFKVVHRSRGSARVFGIVRNLKALAKRRKIAVCEHSIVELKRALLGKQKGNRRDLMAVLSEKYPFLRLEYESEKQVRAPYRIRMFEAVAAGYVCHAELERKMGTAGSD